MGQQTEFVEQFDKDGDQRLNKEERKAAREFLSKQGRRGGGGPPRMGAWGREGGQETRKGGPKITPADVAVYPEAPLYDVKTLRTLFLEFENADWEKELADFKDTDVEVPATLTVDGKVYRDVGVHFRGMSSFMMVSEGQKRSLNLSFDWVNPHQNLYGYTTLNLLNSHEDPTFLHTVLCAQITRDYVPAPQANFVRVVINGESWGVYVNSQQFDKTFTREWFGTPKGARWKVEGSPGGSRAFQYLGDDLDQYRRVYQIKSREDLRSWAQLINLCKALNETPAERLEQVLAPMLDLEGTLKFLALDNVFINNDGYWIRASDVGLYREESGRFHIVPHDINETFSTPGGPGLGGGGGPGGGPGGPGGPGFGPGMFVAPRVLTQADQDGDKRLTKAELGALADAWYGKLDADKTGGLTQEQWTAKLDSVLLPSSGSGESGALGGRGQGFGGPPGGGPGGFGPAMFVGPALFAAADANKDSSLTQPELRALFEQWSGEWDAEKTGSISEEQLRNGLNTVLMRAAFGGRRGGPGGQPGQRGQTGGRNRGGAMAGAPGGGFGGSGGGPGGGPGAAGGGSGGGGRVNGVELDPFVTASDQNKVLLAKLLAVPALRAQYLGYIRSIAEKWLDWNRLGPLAKECQALIAEDVKTDDRKLDSTESFLNGVDGTVQESGGFGRPGGRTMSIKSFVEQRRAYLLNHAEVKKAVVQTAGK